MRVLRERVLPEMVNERRRRCASLSKWPPPPTTWREMVSRGEGGEMVCRAWGGGRL